MIECNVETKQCHPTRLIQGPIAHRYFWEGGEASFPALSFSPHSTYSQWGSLLWQYLSCRGIGPPLTSGLMEEWKTEKSRECTYKFGESQTTRIIMATVRHVTAWVGLRKFHANGFLLDRVYIAYFAKSRTVNLEPISCLHQALPRNLIFWNHHVGSRRCFRLHGIIWWRRKCVSPEEGKHLPEYTVS